MIVGTSAANRQEGLSALLVLLLIGGPVTLALAAGVGWVVAGAALRPVERMRRQVAELHARDAGDGLPVPRTHDEISRLAETFNGLLARLHAAVTRERSFVADAGHELRTPLSVLKGELELARRAGRSRGELARTIEVAAGETDRLVRLAEDLLILASDTESPPPRAQHFDLTALTRAAITARTARAGERGVTITLSPADDLDATGDPGRIRQAVDNLLSNALRHAAAGTTVTVCLGREDGQARVSVTDNGPGFPPAFLPVAFDRFTRADEARSRPGDGDEPGGNGLGLAIVQAVMTSHDGTATAENMPSGGARVTLRWPVA